MVASSFSLICSTIGCLLGLTAASISLDNYRENYIAATFDKVSRTICAVPTHETMFLVSEGVMSRYGTHAELVRLGGLDCSGDRCLGGGFRIGDNKIYFKSRSINGWYGLGDGQMPKNQKSLFTEAVACAYNLNQTALGVYCEDRTWMEKKFTRFYSLQNQKKIISCFIKKPWRQSRMAPP